MGQGTPTNDEARRGLRHELRTPVHHILGCSELLLEEAKDEGLQEWVPALEEIHAAGQRALALVNDRLDPGNAAALLSLDSLRGALGPSLDTVIVQSAGLEARAADLGREDLLPDLAPIRLAAQRLLKLVDDYAALADGAAAEPTPPPPAEREPAQPVPTVHAAGPRAAPAALLVVDDIALNRDMLSRRLERDGHTVLRAENGRQALELLATTPVDLVLLDMLMPEMDGYEVLRRRQADPRLTSIPFIVISALDEMDSVVRCIELGAEDYLPKPFDPVLLRARIGACLERKRLRDQELEYLRQVEKVTAAAAALEAGSFLPASLADVAARPDELGGLARAFNSMVVALEAAHQAEVRAEVVRHELGRAREIQERLLPAPEQLVQWPGQLELAVRFRAAREMSGDFYDVLELAPTAAPDALAPLQIAVGDVAGKSIPAALVMALARTTLRAVVQRALETRPRSLVAAAGSPVGRDGAPKPTDLLAAASPAATMRLASGVLHRDVGRRDFVACSLALVEPPAPGRSGPRLRLANAGQVPPLLCRAGEAAELEPAGDRFPLGVLSDPCYEELLIDLQPADVVIFASDGLPEAPARGEPSAASPEMFGFERLAASAAYWATHAADADAVAAGLWGDVNEWSGETSDHDDMTLVVLRVPGE